MEKTLYTFRPNTITYGIPVDHPIGVKAGRAKIGVVFHTHYTGDDLASMQAKQCYCTKNLLMHW